MESKAEDIGILSHTMVFHLVLDCQQEAISVIVKGQAMIHCWEGTTSKESQCATANVTQLIRIHVIGIGMGICRSIMHESPRARTNLAVDLIYGQRKRHHQDYFEFVHPE